MSEFTMTPAVREAAPITAAIIGGSGAGKTYSALKLARGLVGKAGKIGLIDTEGGRSLIYADTEELRGDDGFVFHHLPMIEPYRSERFRSAFRFAESQGCDAIIIDTISHEHEGFLEYADAEQDRMSNRKDNTRSKWIKPKMERKRFYSAIASSAAHCIVTIRLNRIVDMDSKPAREIYKPECDKDLPYRLDLSVELDANTHKTKYIKVPEPLKDFVRDGVMIEQEHGRLLMSNIAAQAKPSESTERIRKVIANLEDAANSGSDVLREAYQAAWRNAGPEDVKDITPDRAELQRHVDRLKQIAADADAAERLKATNDDPSDIGANDRHDEPEADDDIFPGDRP